MHNRQLWTWGAVSLLGMALSSTALASDYDHRAYIAPMVSYGFFDDDIDSNGDLLDLDDEVGIQLSVGKPLGRFINAELQVLYFDDIDNKPFPDDVDILGYGGSLLLFPVRGAFSPFGILGYSYGEYDFGDSEPNADLYDFGLGFTQDISDYGVALRGEYRYRVADLDGGNGFDADFDDHIVSLGLQVPLGEPPVTAQPIAEPAPRPRPAPPGDSDGDGVIDRWDQCANTPANSPVNSNGCVAKVRQEKQEPAPVVLRGVHFEFDSARLTSKARARLDNVVNALQGTRGDVRIEGHTDSIGPASYNQGLSERRARSVEGYLIEHGITGRRLSTRGYGETRPVAPNTKPNGSDNPAGRAENRRVELHGERQ